MTAPIGATVEVHVAMDPDAFLILTSQRISVLRASIEGQMLLWGRRPRRAGLLGAVFVNL